ncbi:uncharacterized protein LOC105842929 [Bombyx mori]|uniref:uncharacterized protein LOC105842929 n=1 Tax=Bombyx mori TaxID=7091 RepID=UPI002ED62D04
MEDIVDIQTLIHENIVKLGINIKKDSADRKTLDYFRRRLATLDEYWKEYEYNYDRIRMEVSQTHPYFVQREFEKAMKAYEEVKSLINQQHQKLLARASNQVTNEQSKTSDDEPRPEDISVEAGPSSPRPQVKTTGTNSKIDDLLRRQYANFKAFLRTTSNIDVEAITEKWEFKDALKTLQSRWLAIDYLHWEIESELCGDNETYSMMFDRYEKQFYNLKKEINTGMWSVAHRDNTTPQLDIPVFSGNYDKWVSFRDLFTEAIHKNPSMSKAQKMQHLKSKVRREAERLIQHVQISSDNYLVSWEFLTNRYDNKYRIFSSYMNIMLNIPNKQHKSLFHIKTMHDTTREALYGIRNLGVDITSWDPMIVHIFFIFFLLPL